MTPNLPPTSDGDEARWFTLDQTLVEARAGFADLSPDAVERLVDEAVAATQVGVPAKKLSGVPNDR